MCAPDSLSAIVRQGFVKAGSIHRICHTPSHQYNLRMLHGGGGENGTGDFSAAVKVE